MPEDGEPPAWGEAPGAAASSPNQQPGTDLQSSPGLPGGQHSPAQHPPAQPSLEQQPSPAEPDQASSEPPSPVSPIHALAEEGFAFGMSPDPMAEPLHDIEEVRFCLFFLLDVAAASISPPTCREAGEGPPSRA